jgi:AraC-like DNA-binding protein
VAVLDGDTFRRLALARDFLATHHAEPLVVADAARRAGISPYHFLRLFARAFQVTPYAFLQSVRIDRARALLARSDASVTDVCLEVGYASLGSFSSLFARETGASPAAYRRRIPCGFITFYGAERPLLGASVSRSSARP